MKIKFMFCTTANVQGPNPHNSDYQVTSRKAKGIQVPSFLLSEKKSKSHCISRGNVGSADP